MLKYLAEMSEIVRGEHPSPVPEHIFKAHLDANAQFPQHFKDIDYPTTTAAILNPPNWHQFADSEHSTSQHTEIADTTNRLHITNNVRQFADNSSWLNISGASEIPDVRFDHLHQRMKWGVINLILQTIADGPKRPDHEIINEGPPLPMQKPADVEKIVIFFNDPTNRQKIEQMQAAAYEIQQLLSGDIGYAIGTLWKACLTGRQISTAIDTYFRTGELATVLKEKFEETSDLREVFRGANVTMIIESTDRDSRYANRTIQRYTRAVKIVTDIAMIRHLKSKSLEMPFGVDQTYQLAA